jgi:hypothetical protein
VKFVDRNSEERGSISPTRLYTDPKSANALALNQQYFAQLYWYADLENTLNFYAVCSAMSSGKINVNLLPQNLPLEC